jgi:hypothetical protein
MLCKFFFVATDTSLSLFKTVAKGIGAIFLVADFLVL